LIACPRGEDRANGGERINFTGWEFGTVHRVAFVFTTVFHLASNAQANDAKVESVLKTLDPDARFEQVCDLEALKQISRDGKTYKPERTIVSALSMPKVAAATMTGTGGAFKSKGQWFQFSFKCQTTADHMKILAFSYQIGEPIPPEKWEPHGLW
jgi:hypothetical protein